MKTSDFYFELPEELIAQFPSEKRDLSRLMVLNRNSKTILNSQTEKLADFLPKNALLVFNNSKVRHARVFAEAIHTHGRVEFLFLEKLEDKKWKCMVSKSKKQVLGKKYLFPGKIKGKIAGLDNQYRIVEFSEPLEESYFDSYGHIPLPPYIRRDDAHTDHDRYQTIYSKELGSVAAPTAGLHFTERLFKKLKKKNIETAFVTLHVGLGTFLPVRSKNIEDHQMHREIYSIDHDTAESINNAKRDGRPIVAVGTTSVRVLESAAKDGVVQPGKGATDIFIYPGYSFQLVDMLFTNFHTPESTLLMLVSAFAGKDFILKAYRKAVEDKYRFFSYGDAMLIL